MKPTLVDSAARGSRFHQLAQDLVAEHERETKWLRSEIERLRDFGVPVKCEPDVLTESSSQLAVLPADATPLPSEGQAVEPPSYPARATIRNTLMSIRNSGVIPKRLSWFSSEGLRTYMPHVSKRVSRFSSEGLRTNNMAKRRNIGNGHTAEILSSLVVGQVGKLRIPRKWKQRVVDTVQWIFALEEPERDGLIASIVLSHWFVCLCASVIVLNAFVTVIEANIDMTQALAFDGGMSDLRVTSTMKVVEVCFTSFYVIELALRLYVHQLYFFVNDDWRWNTMDCILVLLAAVDMRFVFGTADEDSNGPNLNFLRMVRIFKIVKVFRVVRMIKFVEELRLMFECVLNSFAQLVWCLLMICFVLYVFALLFVQALAGHLLETWDSIDDSTHSRIESEFGNVWKSMVSLFQAVTGGVDWHEHSRLVGQAGQIFHATYLFYIAFFAIAAWNIVTGTFVEKAFELAVPSLDGLISEKHRRDAQCAAEMMQLLRNYIDEDHDGLITIQEFNKHIQDPHVCDLFTVRGLDVKDARTFFHMLLSMSDDTEHQDRVDLQTFVGCALRLQGWATNLDLQTVHYNMKRMYKKTMERLGKLDLLINHLLMKPAGDLVKPTRTAPPEAAHRPPEPGSPKSVVEMPQLDVDEDMHPDLFPEFEIESPCSRFGNTL